jgi:hypothetical protein
MFLIGCQLFAGFVNLATGEEIEAAIFFASANISWFIYDTGRSD